MCYTKGSKTKGFSHNESEQEVNPLLTVFLGENFTYPDLGTE